MARNLKPVIIAIDDDPFILNSLASVLKEEYAVRLFTSGRMAPAEVSDSGIGVKKEDMGRLFDDFIRVDGEKNKDVQGTGLGLAITQSLCQRLL